MTGVLLKNLSTIYQHQRSTSTPHYCVRKIFAVLPSIPVPLMARTLPHRNGVGYCQLNIPVLHWSAFLSFNYSFKCPTIPTVAFKIPSSFSSRLDVFSLHQFSYSLRTTRTKYERAHFYYYSGPNAVFMKLTLHRPFSAELRLSRTLLLMKV